MSTSLRRSSRLLPSSIKVTKGMSASEGATSLEASQARKTTRVKRALSPPNDVHTSSEEAEKDFTTQIPKKRARKLLLSSADAVEAQTPPAKKAKGTKKSNNSVAYSLPDFPERSNSFWKIGPHVSAAGGVENAILNAASIGATAFALFLKSQRKWDSPPLTENSIEAFKARLKTFKYDVKHILPHGNYLINLGNPDLEKREKSYQCFLDELKRCEQLGLILYNFHPGSSVGQVTQEESLSLVAECLNRAHKETKHVATVIESMVGSGNVLCSKFSEIGKIIEQVEDKSRVGVCLDTCHIFAAGYDIRTEEGWKATMAEFERDVGLKYLKGMHINDSKAGLASRKDRHENIGLGHLGMQTFSNVLNDVRTQDIPLIMETPAFNTISGTQRKNQFKPGEGWDIWRTEVAVLNKLAGSRGTVSSERGESFAKWTEEIRDVVKRVSSAAQKKEGKGKTKKSTRRRGKPAEGGESQDSCNEEDEDDV